MQVSISVSWVVDSIDLNIKTLTANSRIDKILF